MHSLKNDKSVKIEDLQVSINNNYVVKGIDFEVTAGKITALVGESGCGKTTVALALMGLLGKEAEIGWNQYKINGNSIDSSHFKKWDEIRGNKISMIFQDAFDSLNPIYRIENQIIEGIRAHRKINKRQAYDLAVEQLKKMNFKEPDKIMRSYPFELSGGMCQRVMIAMSVLMEPDILIADEPTTALDVTVQAEILKQIHSLSRNKKIGVLFITHDLGVVAEIADEIYVMNSGIIVEQGNTKDIFNYPQNAYTRNLLQCAL